MNRTALLLCALLVASPLAAQQKSNELASDAALTTKVHTALMNDVGLGTLRRINVDKRLVTLKGVVDSQDTKQRAEAVTRRVSGVSEVKNELRVKGG